MQFDDHSYGVIDFKTSNIKTTHVQLYSRQLRAYAYALEHPGGSLLALSPISVLGLLSFTPVGKKFIVCTKRTRPDVLYLAWRNTSLFTL